ncbi:hypothetical protein [Lysobacter sp. M15]|uniref:hypothetical protein n=1 Tax=Lysobacter sp. M15 TaxID=2916837 RepID=UPI001F574B11|nr:hypothetical protein [Lysobacter sp. M15]
MKATLNNWLPVLLLSLPACIGNACAVERTRPSIEERVQSAELVVVTDDIELLPNTGQEFDKFFRVRARVASVLKGQVAVGDRIEVVVDNTIAERRNDCCVPGNVYVLFLRERAGKYHFVGSPSGAVLVELKGRKVAAP